MKTKGVCLLIMGWLSLNAVMAQNFKLLVSEQDEKMMKGKFEPTWESLKNYEVPEWFKNAKFGIWAHWGPQCQEGTGDWMAQHMYKEDSKHYKHHVEHYGHPSEVGFKDVIPHWKAEKWNPEKLVGYYKKLGAQYFFAMGNHHDNMDLWDSKYQPWNSVNMGPKRDVLAEWEAAARKHKLPFGISFHADHAWTWYESSQGCDRKGPKAGIPYDGNMTKTDGKGKWWEEYDPQDLYAQRHPLSKKGGNTLRKWEWKDGASIPTAEYCTNFYNRTLDAINCYNPDLIYFDAHVLPLYPISDAGLKIAAHYYNHNMATHKGKLEAVMFGKKLNLEQRDALVWDVERGAPHDIVESPWQTCSCIGNWHYNTEFYEQGRYKSPLYLACLLMDIVSKNGNLLLSVPLKGDGTFDEKEKAILDEFGGWMAVNKEAVFNTRPWKIFGEGLRIEKDGKSEVEVADESVFRNMSKGEVRFTQTDRNLYAALLAWPEDGQVLIKSLASGSRLFEGRIKKVELLGYGKVSFTRIAEGLSITIPDKAERNVIPVFKIKK